MTVYAMCDKNGQCIGVFDYVRDACKLAEVTKESFHSQMSRGTKPFRNGTTCVKIEIGEEE